MRLTKLASLLTGIAFFFAIAIARQTPSPGSASTPSSAQTSPAGRGRGRGPALPRVISPEVSTDGRVTFRLRAPDAVSVSVAGQNAPSGPGVAGAMTKGTDGVWSFTTEPLPPDG